MDEAHHLSLRSLFQPFRLKSLTLRNRIVMAPMTRSFSPLGLPTPEVASYYHRRAVGEVGLIVTEGTVIDRPSSMNDPAVPHFFGAALDGWRRVVEAVHADGGLIAPQLWHVGASRNPAIAWAPETPAESPSGFNLAGEPQGHAMTDAMIADTIAAFARAAADARALNFDAVELHGAHGYLIDQFLWARTNRRTDAWGGASTPERTRFAVELVRAVRAALGPELPLILRLSQWKVRNYEARMVETPDEMRRWLEPLAAAGVDCFHCSQHRYWEPEFPGSDLNFAGWAKKLTGLPTITVGAVGLTGDFAGAVAGEVSHPASLERLILRLDRGEFDLVAVGRALLADPDWVTKIRTGRASELRDYHISLKATLH